MNKLIALALVATLATITMPLPITAGGASTALEWDETGPVTCDDGSVVAQDEECPDPLIVVLEYPDGSTIEVGCPLKKQYRAVVGWTFRLVFVNWWPVIVPWPVWGTICDYGDCGRFALEDLGVGGPS